MEYEITSALKEHRVQWEKRQLIITVQGEECYDRDTRSYGSCDTVINNKKKIYIYLVFISVSGTEPLKSLEFLMRVIKVP